MSGLPSYNLSVAGATSPLVGETLAKPETLQGLPRAPLRGKTPSGRREMSRMRQRVDDWQCGALTERLYEGNANQEELPPPPASPSRPAGAGGRRKRRRGAGPGLTRGRRGRRAGCSGPRRWCKGRTAAQAPAEAGRYRRKSRRISRPPAGAAGRFGRRHTAPAPRPGPKAAPAPRSRCRRRPGAAARPRPRAGWRGLSARRAAPAAAARPARPDTRPPGAEEQQPRRKGQIDAEIVAVGAGQEHRPRQREVESHEPCRQPQKAPRPRPAVGSEDDDRPGGCLVRQPQRPWSRRGQQDEGGRRPQRRPGRDPPSACCDAAQKPRRQQKQRSGDEIYQKQHIKIDHRADMPRPLWGEYSRCTR